MREVNNSLRDLAKNKQLDQREKLKSSLDNTQDMLAAREDEVKVRTLFEYRISGVTYNFWYWEGVESVRTAYWLISTCGEVNEP